MRISIVAIFTLATLTVGELLGWVSKSSLIAIATPQTTLVTRAIAREANPLESPTAVNNLATITVVQAVSPDSQLQQIVCHGRQISQNQLQKDLETILATGGVAKTDVTTRTRDICPWDWLLAQPEARRSPSIQSPHLGARLLMPLEAGVEIPRDDLARSPFDPPRPQNLETQEFAEQIVSDIQIRFVDRHLQPFDEDGQPIPGRTRRDFILGELKLKTGQVFRQDLLEQDLRRLRRMDLFKNVQVSLEPDATGVKLIYDLQERRSRSINPGGGNSGDVGLFGTLSYRDRNIGGDGQQLRARVQVAREDVQYSARFTNPYRLGEPDRLGYSVGIFRSRDFSQTFDKNIDLPNGDDVLEGRIGGGVQLLRSFNQWNASLGLNYTRLSVRDRDWDISPVDELGHPLSLSGTGIDELVTVSLGVTRDWRNSSYNPTSGSLLSLSTDQSIPIGTGNIFMNRLRANYVQYVPMRQIGADSEANSAELAEMLAFNLQAGTVIGDLPPIEAFQLGGLNSVRGYANADLASARSFVLGSVEYRFPIVSWMGGVIFFDLGSDFGSGDTVLGSPAPLRNKPGSGFGYGIGLRVPSPLGLIRGDLGINDNGDVRFEITTGQRF